MGEKKPGKEVPPESRLHTDAGEALVTGYRSNKINPVQTASPDFERITCGNMQ
jgi:signal transduction histidine kinase